MLDIKLVREQPDAIREMLRKRSQEHRLALVDELLELDQQRRRLQQEMDSLRARRNVLSQDINKAKKAGKNADHFLREAKALPAKVAEAEQSVAAAERRQRDILLQLPNMVHPAVPTGKDDEANRVERTWGTPRKFPFKPKSHVDLLEQLKLADIERAGKAAGARFYYELNELVLLDLALQRFALDRLAKKGFTLVLPPYMLRREAYEGATAFTSFEETLYKIEGEDLYLIATAEHPLVAMRQNETLEPAELPLKLAGVSPCFRKEAGAHGRDTKGIFRVHHFHKVEQVAFCAPEDSAHLHEELMKNAEEVFQALEIPHRVVTVASGSMGDLASRQYDLEVWLPGQGTYREAVSCSNCTDFQARTLGIKMRKGNDMIVPHTLNSTAIAVQRAMVAIIENFQNEDGSIAIPKALQPYAGFKSIGATRKGKK